MGKQEEIQQRINERLTIDANTLEGGFSQQIIGSVAYELANIEETELNVIADKAFVATAHNEDLDRVGSDYGILRREESAAFVYLEITGDQFAVINQNVKAVYNNLVYTVQEYKSNIRTLEKQAASYQKQLNKEDRKEEQPERSDCSSLLGGKWQPQAYFRFTQEKEKQLAMQSVTYSIMSKTRAKQRTAD